MKRVLIFSVAYFPLIGGAEVAVRELCARMEGFEFEMVTAAIEPGLPKVERIGNITVHRVGFGHPIDKWLMPLLAVSEASRLHQAHPFDAIWSVMASYAGFAAERFKRLHSDVPMLLTLQEGDPLSEIEHKARWVRPWFLSIFRRADGLQAISHFLMEWGTKLGFKGRVSEVVPNGVMLAEFSKALSAEQRAAIRARFGFGEGDFVVASVSRLVVKNGIDILIESLMGVPERVKLLLIGEGPLASELRKMAVRFGLGERVIFAGAQAYQDLPELYASADAFCRPARSEGMGNVFIEAMAVGTPVIATPVGGIVDFAADGVNCLLAKPEDAASVAAAIRKLSEDAALRTKLVEGGRQTSARYDWDPLAKRMEALFNRLVVQSNV